MKPTQMQYFFATRWLDQIWFTGIPLLCALAVIRICKPTPELLSDGRYLLQFLGIVLAALLIGFFSVFIIGWPILGPIAHYRSLINGAPFHKGDLVHILVGPHRDRVVRVYEVWESRGQARVELGEKERQEVRDVFSDLKICKEQDA